MKIAVTPEFREICSKIVIEAKSEAEWAAIESDDIYQTPNYVGGFDATEMEFCFSYYDAQRKELWFQVSLSEVEEIAAGGKVELEARPAEK